MSPKMMKVLRNGSYEADEARQLPFIVEEGERLMELGGGIGYISALVAKLGRAESIVVFEADANIVELMKRTHERNKVVVDVVWGVLTPKKTSETVPFYVRRDFWASSLSSRPWGFDRIVDVPVFEFDAVRADRRPSMIVCDIEGGEGELFDGIDLTGVNKVYLELHRAALGPVGIRSVFDQMSKNGFYYDVDHSARSVVLFRKA